MNIGKTITTLKSLNLLQRGKKIFESTNLSKLKLPGDEKLDEIFKATIKPKDLQIGET